MKKKNFSSNFSIYWNFRVFVLLFFYILLNNTNLLNYWSSLCKKQGVVVVGHSLYLHILFFFLITLTYTILIFFKGFIFFLAYHIGSVCFLVFYLKSFNLYTDYLVQGAIYIEIPSDLLCRLFLLFIPISFVYEYIVQTKYKYRWVFVIFLIGFFFFFIPTLQNSLWLIFIYVIFEIKEYIPIFFQKLN